MNIPEDAKDFEEIPNKLKYSLLRVNFDQSQKFPKSFGWLVEPGIYYGEVCKLSVINDELY